MKERTYQIVAGGIPVTVTKKRMKHMYLRVRGEDGSAVVSAPHQISDAAVRSFVEGRIEWIKDCQEKYRQSSRGQEEPALGEAEIKRRKALLKAEVEKLVGRWEPVMKVKVSGITIKRMKTRWGSCNAGTRHININLALYDKEPDCLEYVVVHEMCHILEASHSRIFWDYMTQFYPEWKMVRQKLKEVK